MTWEHTSDGYQCKLRLLINDRVLMVATFDVAEYGDGNWCCSSDCRHLQTRLDLICKACNDDPEIAEALL